MTVGARLGAKVRGRFSRRGAGDDQVSILPGDEEEEAAAGAQGSAGAPRPAEEEEEEEGTGAKKVRFAALPGSYEPLRPPRGSGKRPYGKRLKKYGKILHSGIQAGAGRRAVVNRGGILQCLTELHILLGVLKSLKGPVTFRPDRVTEQDGKEATFRRCPCHRHKKQVVTNPTALFTTYDDSH